MIHRIQRIIPCNAGMAGTEFLMAGDHERQRPTKGRGRPHSDPRGCENRTNQALPERPAAAVRFLRPPRVSEPACSPARQGFSRLARSLHLGDQELPSEGAGDRPHPGGIGRPVIVRGIGQIDDPALLQYIESEPVVAVLLEFMHTRDRYEQTMEVLWKELRKFARGRRLLVRGKKRFPGGPNVLSRILGLDPCAKVLERLGIILEMKRSNGCKVTLTRRLDDPATEPSGEPSAPNTSTSQGLPSKDDMAARIQRLQQRKLNSEGSHFNE